MVRFQTHKSSCGPAAIRNALDILGHTRSEEELVKLTGQTVDGTPASAMLRALRAVKESCGLLGPGKIEERDPGVAALRLEAALRHGRPVIVCVRVDAPWDHWAVAVGLLGDRVISVDSGDNEHTRARAPEQWAAWWRGPATARRPFYGIVL